MSWREKREISTWRSTATPNTDRGKKLRETICEKLHFTSLEYQSLDKLIEAIGLEPCKVCTYCWNGKE